MESSFALFAQVLAQVPTDPLSGGAGWVGAGLLGAVLAWLMFVHLPAKDKQAEAKDAKIASIVEIKDKQIAAILTENTLERERERTDRHDRANAFQKLLNDLAKDHKEQMREMHNEHAIDAEKDRQAFLVRSSEIGNVMKMAIERQTLELEKAIRGTCMFQQSLPQVIKERMDHPK